MTTTKRNGTSKIIAIISSIIIPLLVLAAGWGANRIRVMGHGERLDKLEPEVQVLRDAVTEQTTNIKWIRAQMEKSHE